jgi:hypothetical protein
MSMGSGRRGGRGGRRNAPEPPHDDNALILSWSLFSGPSHERVATSTLRYTGSDADEAMKSFLSDLHEALPDARCAGWKSPGEPSDAAAPEPASIE